MRVPFRFYIKKKDNCWCDRKYKTIFVITTMEKELSDLIKDNCVIVILAGEADKLEEVLKLDRKSVV